MYFQFLIFPLPFTADVGSQKLVRSKLSVHPLCMIFEFIVIGSIKFAFTLFIIWSSIWLFNYWKSYTASHLDQAILYVTWCCAITLFLASYFTIITRCTEICYLQRKLSRLNNLQQISQ